MNILSRLNKIETSLEPAFNIPPYSILTSIKIQSLVTGVGLSIDILEEDKIGYEVWLKHRGYVLYQSSKRNESAEKINAELDMQEERLRSISGFKDTPTPIS